MGQESFAARHNTVTPGYYLGRLMDSQENKDSWCYLVRSTKAPLFNPATFEQMG